MKCMSTVEARNTLLKIKNEYNLKKKQLGLYDKFIDRHQVSIVGGAFFMCALCLSISFGMQNSNAEGSNTVAIVTEVMSFVFFIVTIAIAFVTGARKSTKNKIEKQLLNLRDEAVAFKKYTKEHGNITRDELGFWRDVEHDTSQKNKKNKSTLRYQIIGVLIIIIVLSAPFIVSFVINTLQANSSNIEQLHINQARCLDDAHAKYMKAWNDADKDGDGSVSYADGATNITTSYFDGVISCYRTYKTSDSEDYIADYQAKRQQEVDKYTAWLESQKSTVIQKVDYQIQSPVHTGLSCSSNTIGSTVYTHCGP